MRTIYKYPLEEADHQTVEMPACSEIIKVAHGFIWAIVDTSRLPVRRILATRGTGQEIPNLSYIGTYFKGPFVWHVFDGGEYRE